MFWLVFIPFLIVSVALVGLILSQEPKQSGLGDALGGGGAMPTDFSSLQTSASSMHKVTVYFAIAWGVLAILLQIVSRF